MYPIIGHRGKLYTGNFHAHVLLEMFAKIDVLRLAIQKAMLPFITSFTLHILEKP